MGYGPRRDREAEHRCRAPESATAPRPAASPPFEASTSFDAGFTGLYKNCSLFAGGAVWMAGGFDAPVTLDIAQSGSGLTATYSYDDSGVTCTPQ